MLSDKGELGEERTFDIAILDPITISQDVRVAFNIPVWALDALRKSQDHPYVRIASKL